MRIKTLSVNGVPVENLPSSGAYQLPLTITGDLTIAATFAEWLPSGNGRLKGTYNIVARSSSFLAGSGGIGESMASDTVTATFDGAGKCTVKYAGKEFDRQNGGNGENVGVNNDSGSSSACSYTVSDEGVFSLNLTFQDGSETLTGAVGTDGNVMFIGGAKQETGEWGTEYLTQMVVGLKAGSGMTRSSVAGTYRLVGQESGFWQSQNGNTSYVSKNTSGNNIVAVFDGNGGCTVNMTGKSFSISGGQNGETVNVENLQDNVTDCTYSVSSAGILKITMAGGAETVTGWVSADGNAALVGGTGQDTDTEGKGFWTDQNFGVREGSAMDTSSIAGTYRLTGSELSFQQSNSLGGSSVSEGISGNDVTISFDGTGGCNLSFSRKSYEKVRDHNGNYVINVGTDGPQTLSCSYSVQPEGAFTLNIATGDGNETVSGRVSRDGNAVVMGGANQRTEEWGTEFTSELMIGVKTAMPAE
jgi:hypothetical protein